ncbi:MAG: substrate-binding domain-containing protein, partial [Actinobacteria bacterium]|nr:substrate-binding domain-containing protein [Actinomycetota bacterium]
DNINGAYMLTEHIVKHGYKNIAYISGDTEETTGKKRLEGYLKALNEYGIEAKKDFIKVSSWDISGGYNSTIELFKNSGMKPEAIFLANSIMALGAVKALRELSITVPDEVALVSFDNLSFIESMSVPLTTLEKIDDKIGKTAAEILYKNIINPEKKEIKEIYIKAGLVIRESCGCKKGVK